MRRAACIKPALAVAAAAALLSFSLVHAVQVSGGGSAQTDCYARFEVRVPASAAVSTQQIECMDGDAACDNDGECTDSCRFPVALCLNQPGDGSPCVPPYPPDALRAVNVRPARFALPVPPLDSSVCGAFTDVVVKLRRGGRGRRPGKATIRVNAMSSSRPRRDRNQLWLRCLPNPACTVGAGGQCARNAAGGPDRLRATVLADGNDLDNGWTGVWHNFPVPGDARLELCLSDCDGTADAECTVTGFTGPGTPNGSAFGPPLPLLAGGVPACVVNHFQPGPVTGTANITTGDLSATVDLFADVYVTDAMDVCPRCDGGTCDSGWRRGAPCTVDGTVEVVNSLSPDKTFRLSQQCIPAGLRVLRLNVTLPITTGSLGTPGTGGSRPCREGEALGVPAKDNDCDGPCTAVCALGGPACTQMVTDPTRPGETICRDVKGGLSQLCCSDNPTLPCFPTETGGTGIVRTGRPLAPTPPASDPSYSKIAEGVVLAATFCEGATGDALIDTVSGLPGPGALLLNTRMEWLKNGQ